MIHSEKPRRASLLIAEDERNVRELMARELRRQYEVEVAEDGVRALNMLKHRGYDLVLSDVRMPGADGMAVLEACQNRPEPIPCVLITAYGSIETAVEAMKRGAFDFVTKPLNFDRLEMLIVRALRSRELEQENRELRGRLERKFGFEGIVGESAAIHHVLEMVRQVAPTRSTVMITGDSGTGKEMVAQTLHQLSGRGGKFVPVHCAALPTTLLESELFGHEKGAFTGASERRVGRFELADGGTLFLDEIGEIEPSVQVKLLRVLETRMFERLGGVETIKTEARVVAATNRDLRAMVEKGEFREDLFYRLDVVTVRLPSLRERLEDIPLLVRAFIKEFATENGKKVESISEDALAALCAYSWPGNIRELRNCVERMVVLSRGELLDLDNVPYHVRGGEPPVKAARRAATLDLDQNERALIIKALDECGGNRTRAAEKLGISRRTLHRKINSYGLEN